MQKSILPIVCVVFLTSTLSGCGFFLVIPAECINELPSTSARDVLFWDQKYRPQPSTKEEFLKEWGKPVKILAPSENKETWVYERSLWCGFGPIIFFVPIPLLLPVCDGFEHIEFHGNEAKNLHIKRIVLVGSFGADPICRLPRPLHAMKEIPDRLRPSELYESYGIRSVDLKALSKCPLPPTINIVNVETRESDFVFFNPHREAKETVIPKELMDGIVEYLKYGYERSKIKVDNNSAKIIQLSFINAKAVQWFSWNGMIQIRVDIPDTKYSPVIYEAEDKRRGDIYTPIAHAIHKVTRKIIDDPVIQNYILCK